MMPFSAALPVPLVNICTHIFCSVVQTQPHQLRSNIDIMPGKRISVAAGLQPAAAQKTARGADGPVVACVRHWGNAAWVFEGLKTQ